MFADYAVSSETAINVIQGCLVVTLSGEIPDGKFIQIRNDILNKVNTMAFRGVILDLSTVAVLDRYSFNALADTSKMALLLGVPTIFVGFQPGVVSALVDLEVDVFGIRTALTMEDAFIQLPFIAQAYDEREKNDEISEINERECHSDGDE